MNLKVMDEYGIQQTNPSFIGHINPIRYRGYYYDNETGFYYLQTRYYDPTICRFINADNYELVAELSCVAGQLNLYAYANNNPIMLTDESGEGILAAIFTFFAVVGISALDGAISASLSGDNWLLGASAGALGGAIGYFAGFFNPVLGRAVSSLVYDIANPIFQYGKISEADIVNTVIDVSLDVITSGMYSTVLSKGKHKYLLSILTTDIDAVIDIVQTEYIFKKITNQFKSMIKDLYSAGA